MSQLKRLEPGVKYRVLVGDDCKLETDHHGRAQITNAVRSNVGRLLQGIPIRIVGDDGSRFIVTAQDERADTGHLGARGQAVRNVYGAVHNEIFNIFPGYGPTFAGIIMDTIVGQYAGQTGEEWWLYSTDGSEAPEDVRFAAKDRVRARKPCIFARVIISPAAEVTVEVPK
jgi:hypothetical protein